MFYTNQNKKTNKRKTNWVLINSQVSASKSQFIPFEFGELKKLFEGKKDKLRACTKPVTRGCEFWPWEERLEERFESISFEFTRFQTLEAFFLSSIFQVLP